jgi:hypothetical protein
MEMGRTSATLSILIGLSATGLLPACFNVEEPDDGFSGGEDAGGGTNSDTDSDTDTDADTDSETDTGTDVGCGATDEVCCADSEPACQDTDNYCVAIDMAGNTTCAEPCELHMCTEEGFADAWCIEPIEPSESLGLCLVETDFNLALGDGNACSSAAYGGGTFCCPSSLGGENGFGETLLDGSPSSMCGDIDMSLLDQPVDDTQIIASGVGVCASATGSDLCMIPCSPMNSCEEPQHVCVALAAGYPEDPVGACFLYPDDYDPGLSLGASAPAPMIPCDGGFSDPATGLCWQDPPSADSFTQADADAYCEALELSGHDDWRLPTISELRSLVRGCSFFETGGDCGVTDDCLYLACFDEAFSSDECPWGGGPGEDGDYLDPALTESTINSMSWSSSVVGGATDTAWVIWFDGEIGINPQNVADLDLVRCVRSDP